MRPIGRLLGRKGGFGDNVCRKVGRVHCRCNVERDEQYLPAR